MRCIGAFEDRRHLRLRAANRQWRIGSHGLQILERLILELCCGNKALDQPDSKGLLGVQGSSRVKNVLRIGRPDEIDELAHGIEIR